MLKRVLVLQEESVCAEQGSVVAERIARASGGMIMLLQGASAPPQPGIYPQSSPVQKKVAGEINIQMISPLPSSAQTQILPGTEISVVRVSDMDISTLLAAQVRENDLILVAIRSTAVFERCMLARMARKSAHFSPVPVLICREDRTMLASYFLEKARPSRLCTATVALDGSRRAEATLLPAAQLIAALAAPEKGSLHLTRVVLRPDVDALLCGRKCIDPSQRDQAVNEAMDYLCRVAEALHADCEGKIDLTITWSVAIGSDVAEALIGVAERGDIVSGTCVFSGCDLLALATHGHNVQGRWVPGGVTEHLFASSNLPILLA